MVELGRLNLAKQMRFLAKDAVVYGLAFGINRAIAVLTFPLLARHFSVADFGRIDLLTTLVVLGTVLVVFGQDAAVARFFYDRDDSQYRRQIVSQSLFFQLAIAVTTIPICVSLADEIAVAAALGGEGPTVVVLMALQVPFFVLVNFSQNILKWTQKRGRFIFVSTGSALGTMLGLCAGVFWFELTLVGVFLVYLSTRAVFGTIGLMLVREWIVLPRGADAIRKMLPFALPFGLINILITILPAIERWFVTLALDSSSLGLYAAGAKFALLMSLPIAAFEMSWGPFCMSIFRERNAAQTFRFAAKLVVSGLMVLVLLFSAFGVLGIVVLASSRYEGAGVVVFGLAMGLAFQAIGSVMGLGAVIAKRSHLKLPGYIAMIVIAALTMPVLSATMGLGISGIALGSLLGCVAKATVEAWFSYKIYPIAFDFAGTVIMCLTTCAVGAVHWITFGHVQAMGIALVPLLGIPVVALCAWCFLFDHVERIRIATRVRTRLMGQ